MVKIIKRLGIACCVLLAIILVAVAAIGGAAVAQAPKDAAVPATVGTDPSLPHVEIDGYSFHAETFGDPQAPVVIVVHGGPGGDYGPLLNLRELADTYHVLFYDQRGAGLSPRVDPAELTLETSIADLHRLVVRFGDGDPVRLIGHSWGAMLVAAYLAEHPDRVARAVLAEPGALTNAAMARFHAQTAEPKGAGYVRDLLPIIAAAMRLDPPDEHARTDYIYGKMTERFAGSGRAGYRCEQASSPPRPAAAPPARFGAEAYSAIFGPDLDLSTIAAGAGSFDRPLLFLASDCGSFIGAELQREQMGLFPAADLIVIPAAGHNMFLDNPAASVDAVRRYFAEGDGT